MECPRDVGLLRLDVCRLDDRPSMTTAAFTMRRPSCNTLPMNGSVIVWDLETVPDLRGFAAANGLADKTDEEVREAIGDRFPKHIYHWAD
jgi:hypothetical protein